MCINTVLNWTTGESLSDEELITVPAPACNLFVQCMS